MSDLSTLFGTTAVAAGPERRLVGSGRVLAVLTALAAAPAGVGLDELARSLGQNKATVHHALGTLVEARLATRTGRGYYVLGDEFLRLAFAHYAARPEDPRIRPALQRLVSTFGETAHAAVLDGQDIVYRAKLDPPSGAVRLTSVVGGRNPAHSTAVGKLLLARMLPDLAAVRDWIGGRVLTARTTRTAVDAEGLHAHFELVRELGYAVDDRENEEVVNCVAVTLPDDPAGPSEVALSISGLVHRTPLAALVDRVDEIRSLVAEPSEFDGRGPSSVRHLDSDPILERTP